MSLLTDQIFATGVSLNDLIHIVVTGDTSQNPAGSSFKASLKQVASLISGGTSSIGAYLPLSGGTVTGNTYFGASSGITIDQVNNRIGIGTSNPTNPIQAFVGNTVLNYSSSAGGVLDISGSTNLPRMSATIAPSGGNPLASVDIGMRAWTDVTYPGYGKVGDGHLYASNATNGLNIINRQGTTTEDYIRFYAGIDANGNTADIHIQGSGTTRGYVGFGTETPTEKVDVVGTTKTQTFRMTSGATSNYILTSIDSSGNAKWKSFSSLPSRSWGSFYSTIDHVATSTTTAYAMSAETQSSGSGVSVVNGSRFTVNYDGTYNIQFSAQIESTGGGTTQTMDIWLVYNGNIVPNSNTQVATNSNNGKMVAAWNFVEQADAGSYFEINWRVSDTRLEIIYDAGPFTNPTRPAIPSVIVTVTQV